MSGAELRINFVGEATPAEQKAMGQSWDSTTNQPKNDPHVPLERLISVTELVEELRKFTPEPISVAAASQELQEQAKRQADADDSTSPSSATKEESVVDAIKTPIAGGPPPLPESHRGSAVADVAKNVAGVAAGEVAAGAASRAAAGAAATGAAEAGTAAAAGGAVAAGSLGGPVGLAIAAIGALAMTTKSNSEEMDSAFDRIVKVAKSVHDGLESLADDLENYSPAVAAARAQRDIISEMNKFDRGRRIGAEVAQGDAALTRFYSASEKLQTSILEVLLKAMPIIEALADTATAGVTGVDLLVQTVQAIVASIPGINQFVGLDRQKESAEAAAAFQRFTNAAGDILRSNEIAGDDLQLWFNEFINQQANMAPVRPRGVPRRVP